VFNDGVKLPATAKGAHILAELIQTESVWDARARSDEFADQLGNMDRLTLIADARFRCTQPCLA
jgi:hypothetical protein